MADPADITTGATPVRGVKAARWRGFVIHDGRVTYFEERTTMDTALADARAAKERLLNPALPKKIWRRG